MNTPNYTLLDLSSKVEYALLALLELASHHDKKVPLTMSEITAKQPIPERYLEQILTSLRRGGVVKSQPVFLSLLFVSLSFLLAV